VTLTPTATPTSSRLNPGPYVAHIGRIDDQSAGHNSMLTTVGGSVVLDGSTDATLASTNYNGLRIEDPTETGLAGYWKLDEGQGSSVRDVSGGGNPGTLSAGGATWTGASTTIGFDNAGAVSFDGAAGVVSAGATGLPAANATQTISLWARFSSAAATQAMVALTGAGRAVAVGLGGGNLRVWKSGGVDLIATAAPATGVWHHVAYSFDGSTDRLYVDGVASTASGVAHDVGAPTSVFIGAGSASADYFAGEIDDVRVYSSALSARQIGQLAAGRYAGTGGVATVTLGSNVTIPATGIGLAVDSGNVFTSTWAVTVSVAGTPAVINSGTFRIGSNVFNPDGGLTVNPMGTLELGTSAGQLQPGNNSLVAIDGTLTASSTGALIQRDNNGETFRFRVGTFAGSTPTLNITGLAIRDTDADGLWINADPAATTTFTRFDNIIFRRGTVAGTFLKIYAPSLHLPANGLSFGVGDALAALPTYNVVLTGNGIADGETRALFGTASCHTNKTTSGYCQHAWASDDDVDGNGIGDTPGSNGAVVQYIRAADNNAAGTIVGLPTAAFDWSTFTYYSTYVAFNDASGTAARIYVRDQLGNPRYQWEGPAGESIVGTPKWNTVAGTHYLFVAMASGKIYRLVDDGSSLVLASGWPANPYDCGCAVTTPLGSDASNIYFGGVAGGNKVWTLGQASGTAPMGSPLTIVPTMTTASPATWTNAGTTYLFLGVVGHVLEIDATNQTLAADNTNPGAASVFGRISISTNGGNRVLAGDDGGNFWALDPLNFAGTNRLWTYAVAGDSIRSSPYSDHATNTVHFGTEAGKVLVLNTATGAARTGYPFTPGTSSDAIRSAMLYTGGILVVGTTTGKLFIIDRNNGTTGPTLLRQYFFGPTQVVSGVAYDPNAARYLVSTSDPAAKDGRLFYIDRVTDPTGGSL
jgi:hypothetical protein